MMKRSIWLVLLPILAGLAVVVGVVGSQLLHLSSHTDHTESTQQRRLSFAPPPPARSSGVETEGDNRERHRSAQEGDAATPPADFASLGGGSSTHCSCLECTDAVWNSPAPPDAGQSFSCGNRVAWLISNKGSSTVNACRTVATEQPAVCGGCNPDTCTAVSASAPSSGKSPKELYCFKPLSQRKKWTNVWKGKFAVEVKSSDSVCGPSNNLFSDDAVSLSDNELTLQFKKVKGSWVASEVRVMLPRKKQPFSYGTFKFSVKSVSIFNKATGKTVQNYLDKDFAFGMYTWDPTEDYATHENWNHEVDIEIGQWGKANADDGQFLIQPPGSPQYYRFSTNQNPGGGNTYSITWKPTSMLWKTTAGGGHTYSYTTKMALNAKKDDYIQCLPATLEIRMNLWHLYGSTAPAGFTDDHVAQVVVDNFSYSPNYIVGVVDGEICSKDCQCIAPSKCVNNRCAKS